MSTLGCPNASLKTGVRVRDDVRPFTNPSTGPVAAVSGITRSAGDYHRQRPNMARALICPPCPLPPPPSMAIGPSKKDTRSAIPQRMTRANQAASWRVLKVLCHRGASVPPDTCVMPGDRFEPPWATWGSGHMNCSQCLVHFASRRFAQVHWLSISGCYAAGLLVTVACGGAESTSSTASGPSGAGGLVHEGGAAGSGGGVSASGHAGMGTGGASQVSDSGSAGSVSDSGRRSARDSGADAVAGNCNDDNDCVIREGCPNLRHLPSQDRPSANDLLHVRAVRSGEPDVQVFRSPLRSGRRRRCRHLHDERRMRKRSVVRELRNHHSGDQNGEEVQGRSVRTIEPFVRLCGDSLCWVRHRSLQCFWGRTHVLQRWQIATSCTVLVARLTSANGPRGARHEPSRKTPPVAATFRRAHCWCVRRHRNNFDHHHRRCIGRRPGLGRQSGPVAST